MGAMWLNRQGPKILVQCLSYMQPSSFIHFQANLTNFTNFSQEFQMNHVISEDISVANLQQVEGRMFYG